MTQKNPMDPFEQDVNDPATRMRQKEDEIGVDPLVLLHEEIERMKPRFMALAGRYSDMRVWERKAKSLNSVYILEHKAAADAAGKRLSDETSKAMAYADDRYVKFLEESEAEKAEFEWLSVQMQNVREKINRGQAILRAHASERYAT